MFINQIINTNKNQSCFGFTILFDTMGSFGCVAGDEAIFFQLWCF